MLDFLACSCRMSATQCLKHEWLNNLPAKAKKSKLRLKSQLLLQSYMAQRKWKVTRLAWKIYVQRKNSSTQAGTLSASLDHGLLLLVGFFLVNMSLGSLLLISI